MIEQWLLQEKKKHDELITVITLHSNHFGKQPQRPFAHAVISNKDTLIECAGNRFHLGQLQSGDFHGLFRGDTILWSVIGVRGVPCTPCPTDRGRGGSDHRDGHCHVGFDGSVLVRIRDHCKVSGHIETRYENGSDIFPVQLVPSECDPRFIVTLGIFFKRNFQLEILLIRWVLRHQRRAVVPGEFEREFDARFDGSGRYVSNQTSRSSQRNGTYGVVDTVAPSPAFTP